MTDLTQERLKTEWENNPEPFIQAFYATLRDFGYTSLNPQTVRDAIQTYVDGQAPEGVIAMFVHGWLKNNLE